MKNTNPNKITTISIRNKTRWRLDDLRKKLDAHRVGFDKFINAILDNLDKQSEQGEQGEQEED